MSNSEPASLAAESAQASPPDEPASSSVSIQPALGDHLFRGTIRALNLRLVVALCTDLCQDAALRHHASPAAACALGRGLLAGVLLATLTKTEERVTIQIQANGPLRGLTVDAYGDGLVRGFPHAPQAGLGADMSKRQRLAPFLGRDGVVHVVRDIGVRDRYEGQVSFVTAEVDEDVEAYLRNSEQIPSALGCELIMDPAGQIVCAGGVLVQSMPDSPPETKQHLREVQHMLRSGDFFDVCKTRPRSAQDLARFIAGPYESSLEFIDHRPLCFQCRCDRGRIAAMLRGMSLTDLDELIAEGKAEVTCNYCAVRYEISRDELIELRQSLPQREKN